jgi:phospholipase D
MEKISNFIRRKSKNLFSIIVVALVIGFAAGIFISNKGIQNFLDNGQVSISTPSPIAIGSSEIDLCFTPPSGCAKVISNLILQANKSIYVQAYGITSEEIARELIAAHKRGVNVRILLDKSNLHDKYSRMKEMQDAGIEVSIDKVSGIAHNKVIIIDLRLLVTGSFNFTKSADTRNAENVIIVNDKQIAERYLQNWLSRKSKNNHLTKEN